MPRVVRPDVVLGIGITKDGDPLLVAFQANPPRELCHMPYNEEGNTGDATQEDCIKLLALGTHILDDYLFN